MNTTGVQYKGVGDTERISRTESMLRTESSTCISKGNGKCAHVRVITVLIEKAKAKAKAVQSNKVLDTATFNYMYVTRARRRTFRCPFFYILVFLYRLRAV